MADVGLSVDIGSAAIGLVGALLGGAASWGATRAHVSRLIKDIEAHDQSIQALEAEIAEIKDKCSDKRQKCNAEIAAQMQASLTRIHERIDKMQETFGVKFEQLSGDIGKLIGKLWKDYNLG